MRLLVLCFLGLVAITPSLAYAQAKQPAAKSAAGGSEVRYFTAIDGLMDGNADVILKETRQGKTVTAAVLDVCYPVARGSERKDRFVANLAVSGQNLTGQRGQTFSLATNAYKIPGTTFNVSNTSLLGTPNITLMPILTCDPGQNLGPNQYINNSCFTFPKQVGQNGPTTLPVLYGPAFFNTDLGLFKNFQVTESKKLQIRMNAYNFLNHPLWSFNGANLNLGFNGTTGLINTPLFGTVTTKQGHRVVQLAAKFTF